MRFNITLNRTSKQRMLPMDYQYYISAWIYRVLSEGDRSFAQFLHDTGYGQNTGKLYKLFCFSRLDMGKFKMWTEKKLFEVSAQELNLKVAFDMPEAATNFVKGLFAEQEFYLGDKFNGIDFKVSAVAALPEPQFTQHMHYNLITPWVVSSKIEGRKHAKYLNPDDDFFNDLSVKHLMEKYKNTRNALVHDHDIIFTPSAQYKRSGFVIKKDSKDETRVVGNIFDFELTAPVDIHRMLWNAGISEKSSDGFGWVEVKHLK